MSAQLERTRRRLRARELEARLQALGIHCPDGALEPLTTIAREARTEPRALIRPNSGYVIGVR